MIINMCVAATPGTLIPLALRALKVDPALASSVFITTLTDVFGFLSFLGLDSRLSAAFVQAHGDLLTAAYWRGIQQKLAAGEVLEILPYQRQPG